MDQNQIDKIKDKLRILSKEHANLRVKIDRCFEEIRILNKEQKKNKMELIPKTN
jgi:hypothetical protein